MLVEAPPGIHSMIHRMVKPFSSWSSMLSAEKRDGRGRRGLLRGRRVRRCRKCDASHGPFGRSCEGKIPGLDRPLSVALRISVLKPRLFFPGTT